MKTILAAGKGLATALVSGFLKAALFCVCAYVGGYFLAEGIAASVRGNAMANDALRALPPAGPRFYPAGCDGSLRL